MRLAFPTRRIAEEKKRNTGEKAAADLLSFVVQAQSASSVYSNSHFVSSSASSSFPKSTSSSSSFPKSASLSFPSGSKAALIAVAIRDWGKSSFKQPPPCFWLTLQVAAAAAKKVDETLAGLHLRRHHLCHRTRTGRRLPRPHHRCASPQSLRVPTRISTAPPRNRKRRSAAEIEAPPQPPPFGWGRALPSIVQRRRPGQCPIRDKLRRNLCLESATSPTNVEGKKMRFGGQSIPRQPKAFDREVPEHSSTRF
ncbi:hypothetical protein Droror1_Dr00022856 [Drosera rotundifolia]